MPRLGLIISVGASLLRGFEQWLGGQGRSRSVAVDLLGGAGSGPAREFLCEFEARLNAHEPGGVGQHYPCAELQTLGAFFAANPDLRSWDKTATLFYPCVPGRAGQACAEMLQSILSQGGIAESILGNAGRVSLRGFPFDLEDQALFSEHVAGVLALVRQEAMRYRTEHLCDRVVVMATGGFKALTPFMALLGFLDGEEVLYAFEGSQGVLALPPLPLAWDLRFLDEFRSCIRSGEGVPGRVYQVLPGRFRLFFLDEQTAQGVHPPSAFGRMLSADYLDQRHRRFGYGRPLVERLSNIGLRRQLQSLVEERFDYLWLGDQIPETVEHARGHSSRLLDVTRDLLDLTGLELSDHELFALMLAVWLHDIGHGALASDEVRANGRGFPVSLFPSLVRDLHHVLSAEMIVELDYLAVDTRRTVAEMARYHRRKIPLQVGAAEWEHEVLDIVVPPFESLESGFCVEGRPVCGQRLLMLIALLRLVDACDVQADRVINDHYANARQARTDYEIIVYLGRLRRLVAAPEVASGPHGHTMRRIVAGVEDALGRQGKGRRVLRRQILDKAKKLVASEQHVSVLYALGLADAVLFKREQEEHFLLHGGIACVYLGIPPDGTTDQLAIYLLARPDSTCSTAAELDQRVCKVAASIWDEYEAVRDVLDEVLVVDGVYCNDGSVIRRVAPEA